MSKQTPLKFLSVLGSTAALVLGLNLPMRLSAAVQPGGFQYFVGIVGNPSVPDISWSDDELEQIKALGVNMVQLSIAWGGKPANEVLNLEDLDAEQRAKWAFRIKQAKKHGLMTIAQFGVPRFISFNPLQPACILDPTVRKKTQEQLTDFMTSFPEVDDVMVYTFDQQSWLCSEFGPCPRCSGVPLDDRVPGFLNMLNETMQKCRPNTRLWWKPWELSKGQVVMILDKVNPSHFGLVLNPSTSNEVYPFNDRSFKSDLGVKRFVQLAKERNIPVLGEFDHTLYKPLYMMEDFFPQLIYEQMIGWKEMEGVVGVKEYYGFSPTVFSVNAAMLKAWMKSPKAPLDKLLKEIAAPYGSKAAPLMIQAWDYVSQHVQAYPWDTTYLIGPMALDRHWDGSHDWEPVNIPNATWDTPIWKANRRANFMLTQDKTAHPWLFEDAALRFEDSAMLGFKAVSLFDQAIVAGGPKVDDIRMQREIVWKTARSLRAKGLHFQLTLAAQDARMAQGDEKQFGLVTKRMESLLKKDLENQSGNSVVAQKLAEFQRDPKAWVEANFNPQLTPPVFKDLPGHESRATVDWSQWQPRNLTTKTLLFLGDSITAAGGYIRTIEAELAKQSPLNSWKVINRGRGSETVSGLSEPNHPPGPRPCLFARLDQELAEVKPDWVVACYGINDGIYHPFNKRRFAAYQAGIETLIRKVHASGAHLVLLTAPPYARPGLELPKGTSAQDVTQLLAQLNAEGEVEAEKNPGKFGYICIYPYYDYVMAQYAKWLLSLNDRNDVHVIDLRTPMLADVKAAYEGTDGVHPNVGGHEIMAKTFLQQWPLIYKTVTAGEK